MRKILFRGKRIDNGEWVKGKLLTNKRIITKTDDEVEKMPCFDMCDYQEEIDVETLGQYTGLTDKNGTKIFEGDIVRINGWWYASGPAGYKKNMTVVKYDDEVCGFTPMCNYDTDCGVFHSAEECEVIGNVFDNPELLEAVC